MNTLPKQILYFDLDNVLVDFQSGIDRLDANTRQQYEGRLDEVPGIFALMNPMPSAIEAFQTLNKFYDVYILSTAPWENPSAWSDKLQWVKQHLGEAAYKRLILTHHKNLNKGAFLIDDRKKNGAEAFEGQLLQFGSKQYPDWESIVTYLTPQPQPTTYTNIKEILTLDLPLRNDTFIHRIKSDDDEDYEVAMQYYVDVIKEKIEKLNTGKYGKLGEIYEYDDEDFLFADDTQSFIFRFKDFCINVGISDVSIDPEFGFSEVLAYIECTVSIPKEEREGNTSYTDDFEASIRREQERIKQLPDYIQALAFENHCEFECLEETLDLLFTEIAKCEARYEKEKE